MAHKDKDDIDFDKLELELHAAVEADQRYWCQNDAKFRAVHQKVASYEEFRYIVFCSISHLGTRMVGYSFIVNLSLQSQT